MRLRGSQTSELGYAERTSNFTQVATANTSYDIGGLAVPVIAPGGPIIVEAFIPTTQHTVAAAVCVLQLWEDDVNLLQAGGQYMSVANSTFPRIIRARYVPTPGPHTYKVITRTPQAGTIVALMGAGFAGYIRVSRG